MNSLEFKVPCLPESYTKAVKINYGLHHMYLGETGRNFKNLVMLNMPAWKLPEEPCLFEMTNTYCYNWFYKNGGLKKKDVQNLNRLLIDAVFKALGRDDSYLWKVTDQKQHSETEEYTLIKLDIIAVGASIRELVGGGA